jgi:hypothetical protein
MDYEIEDNIPYSPANRRYPFTQMKVGQSVLIRCETFADERRARRAAYAIARYKGWKMRTSVYEGSVRVWRIA